MRYNINYIQKPVDIIAVWVSNKPNGILPCELADGRGVKGFYGVDNMLNMLGTGKLGGKGIIYYDCVDNLKIMSKHTFTIEELGNGKKSFKSPAGEIEFRHANELLDPERRTFKYKNGDAVIGYRAIAIWENLMSEYQKQMKSGRPAFAADIVKALASHFHGRHFITDEQNQGIMVDMGMSLSMDCQIPKLNIDNDRVGLIKVDDKKTDRQY